MYIVHFLYAWWACLWLGLELYTYHIRRKHGSTYLCTSTDISDRTSAAQLWERASMRALVVFIARVPCKDDCSARENNRSCTRSRYPSMLLLDAWKFNYVSTSVSPFCTVAPSGWGRRRISSRNFATLQYVRGKRIISLDIFFAGKRIISLDIFFARKRIISLDIFFAGKRIISFDIFFARKRIISLDIFFAGNENNIPRYIFYGEWE